VDGSPKSTFPVKYGENAALNGDNERLPDHLSVAPNRLNIATLMMQSGLALLYVLSIDVGGATDLDV